MSAAEALFSLEVIVERLFVLPTLPCRFPAIAVKLLDFPTFTIDYVEENQAGVLRDKLTIDPLYEIGPQIPELKRKDSCFHFEKGKSCLYRISADDLRVRLATSPMYALVLDTFCKPARLVGSSIVPLTAAMDHIYEELLKEGLSVPASYGERRLVKVCNLMGTDIGEISIGYRLTSLGGVILSHMPIPNPVAKPITSRHIPFDENECGRPGSAQKVAEPDQPTKESDLVQSAVREVTAITRTEISQEVLPTSGDNATRMKTSAHGTQTKLRASPVEYDDYIVNNVFCPPPLYYNGVSESVQRQWYVQPDEVSVSSDGSHRSSSTSTASPSRGQARAPVATTDSHDVDSPSRRSQGKSFRCKTRACQTESGCHLHKHEGGCVQVDLGELSSHFPVLGSLVSELLRGIKQTPSLQVMIDGLSPSVPKTSAAKSVTQVELPADGRPPVIDRSLAGDLRSGPLPLDAPQDWHDAAANPHNTAGTSGGSRQRRRGSGKLRWGSTRTQKLRLSQTNPEALRRLEAAEKGDRVPLTKHGVLPEAAPSAVVDPGLPAAAWQLGGVVVAPVDANADVNDGAASANQEHPLQTRTLSRMASLTEDESAAVSSRKSLEVRLPVARALSTSSHSDDVATTARSAGSVTSSGPELAASQASDDGLTHREDPEDVAQYRLALLRVAASTVSDTMEIKGAVSRARLPGNMPRDVRTAEKEPVAAIAGGPAHGVPKEQDHEDQEMSKITEQSEPDGSYTDSFDTDISKSVSLPITVDVSDVESSRVRTAEPYTVLPMPVASQGSPTPRGRPSNPVLSKSNPALHRSSSQQEGKPPLSSRSRGAQSSSETQPAASRSRGGRGSAADSSSSRATSVRASDTVTRSVSQNGGERRTPDYGDSDSSYRALRARNEERRRRLSRATKEDMNTESVSSYDPSDRGRASSSPGSSSDWSMTSETNNLNSALTLNRLAPVNKLGYTT